MKKTFLALLAVFSLCATAQVTVIHNVNGYTPTKSQAVTRFSSLVIKDGKVVKTSEKDLSEQYPNAIKFNGEGKTLLPGLIDAHGHIIGLGNNLLTLDVRGSSSIAEIGKRLTAYAKTHKGAWIIGRGWDQTLWPGGQFPTAADLDKYVKDKPVMLTRVDGHAIWVNTKAMELANISSATQTPEGGEIIKLSTGQPSGIFIDKAEELVRRQVPTLSQEQVNLALDKAAEHLLSLGITSAHDAGIDHTTWQVYQARAKQRTMPLRVYAMLSASSPKLGEMLGAGIIKDTQDQLSIRSVKIYADGALGSRGAALIGDYHDRKGHRGLMLENQSTLESLIVQSIRHGYSAHTHAIGDRANRIVLDAYQNVFTKVGGRLLRNRIEHAQIVHPDDIPRFKTLDIIPSMQPVHATSDMHMAEKRLDDKQLRGAYAWQTFLKQGSRVAAGSDFPVELANPFHGLHAAITRQDHQNLPEQGWRPAEKLTKVQALRAFTLDAAYSAFQEYKLGSLEQGKWADFILIDQDYFTVNDDVIDDIQVEQTWIAGELKYQR
ncbi:amidohydrolase [Pseudoalteromonas sp. McH1-7]|uniref:amidohydrolase n=1 Tax=unclassified Pseudoalteromonas TaxID=194690 RepID=UPI001590D4A4|nr:MULTISPECIES: amidohydrolase [unclassified Pseudoalteromonas]NUZ12456.1 amidohydrolase [Pseudoalteromonas sp. McH1-7]USD29224.1 amidohydrolase [Pseudoalteromonas sp. SCSIO 43201]